MDEVFIEQSALYLEAQKDAQIQKIAKSVPTQPYHGDCTSCGLEVEPVERTRAGYKTCITCASLQDSKRRQFAV